MNKDMNKSFKGWITAARPKTLPASLVPVLPGAAAAYRDGGFRLLPVIAAAAAALLLQIAVNLANDYFDFIHGIDTEERVGPPRAAAGGLLSLKSMKLGMAVITALILLVGSYLVAVGGLPILLIGLASVVSVYLYSAGPFPLSSNALGDLFVFIFFGPAAVCGTYYVQTLTLTLPVVLVSAAVGFLVTDILVVNNYRDIETDRKSGKRTLAVLIGPAGTRFEYIILPALASLVPVYLRFFGGYGMGVLLPLVSLPLWFPLVRDMTGGKSGTALNRTLAGTSFAGLAYSILLSAGLLIP